MSKNISGRDNKRIVFKVGVVSLALIFGLLLSELIIRLTDVDWRYVRKNLFYQQADLPSHVPVFDPDIMFKLRPGSQNDYHGDYGSYRVTVNSLGARGKEVVSRKPPHVFRILCFGGSNVYGFAVSDNQTWPAQLESQLNRKHSDAFEVINFGVCAHVGVQMAALARESIHRLNPDLVIFALSNLDSIPFLSGEPVKPYFEAKPDFWRMLIPPEIFDFPSWISDEHKIDLMVNVRVFRMLELALASRFKDETIALWQRRGGEFEDQNVKSIRDFVKENRKRVKICFFIGPYLQSPDPNGKIPPESNGMKTMDLLQKQYLRYYEGLELPVLHLTSEGFPPDFTLVHPPPEVLAWYGENQADWIIREILP